MNDYCIVGLFCILGYIAVMLTINAAVMSNLYDDLQLILKELVCITLGTSRISESRADWFKTARSLSELVNLAEKKKEKKCRKK